MTFGQRLACHIAPIFIRLALGVTLLWAGLGKLILDDYQVNAQNAQTLVDMSALQASSVQGFLGTTEQNPSNTTSSAEPDPESAQPADEGSDEPADLEQDNDDEGDDAGTGGSAAAAYSIILAQDSTTDQSTTVDQTPQLHRLYWVAVTVAEATHPGIGVDGKETLPLLPSFMGDGQAPKFFGWAVALTEVFAGGFLLIGFMARLSGLAGASVMAMALWLTQIGPAALGYKASTLGFLPAPGTGQTFYDEAVYSALGWQIALLAAGLSLFFSGGGALSLDRLLFGSGRASDEFDDD